MKYVLLGKLSADWSKKQSQRTENARAKAKSLGIKIEFVHYTQGKYDFVDVVDAPDAQSMLAFSVWYAQQGYGKIQSMPAFDERTMVSALRKVGARGR